MGRAKENKVDRDKREYSQYIVCVVWVFELYSPVTNRKSHKNYKNAQEKNATT